MKSDFCLLLQSIIWFFLNIKQEKVKNPHIMNEVKETKILSQNFASWRAVSEKNIDLLVNRLWWGFLFVCFLF